MSERWKMIHRRFGLWRIGFSPTKEIWDRFRVGLCPPLPSGAKQVLMETGRQAGRMEGWEKKFKDAVNWLGTAPSYCLTLAIACHVYVSCN